MFRWYMNSAVCFVFLSDLPEESIFNGAFPKCEWLRRGWTLQELVASKRVEFYDSAWEIRGSTPELNAFVSRLTGIDEEVLHDSEARFKIPVARRMAWASKRKTTRIEDEAYCLLGIFDVNMPLIYGEGDKAFMRLQEEIAKATTDLSLLAWEDPYSELEYRGVFASSPKEFANTSNQLQSLTKDPIPGKEFSITNRGIRIEATLTAYVSRVKDYILYLGFIESEYHKFPNPIGIYLSKMSDGRYVRSYPRRFLRSGDRQWEHRTYYNSTIYMSRILRAHEYESIENRFRGAISYELPHSRIITAAPQHLWDPARQLFFNPDPKRGTTICFLLRSSGRQFKSSRFLITCETISPYWKQMKPSCAVWLEDHELFKRFVHVADTTGSLPDHIATKHLLDQSFAMSINSSCYGYQEDAEFAHAIRARMATDMLQNGPHYKLILDSESYQLSDLPKERRTMLRSPNSDLISEIFDSDR
ncbi:HET-domain-containing protein [Hypoxylon trugodes]|uniref:HET-domain-containing protein n=1 Tax=Hypoxylon trugodes TaxID=326681 RepID=UPI00219D53A5|nr:HET-domain-containing protein [Hypoxylon trugodes]KAI1385954.1 HET-domain-containing protein [Hypoxylon trugodes]